jgi:hypothetical protein
VERLKERRNVVKGEVFGGVDNAVESLAVERLSAGVYVVGWDFGYKGIEREL